MKLKYIDLTFEPGSAWICENCGTFENSIKKKFIDMTYDIVNVKITHPSFSWGNGLYAVIETVGTDLMMCKINEDGNLTLYGDGKMDITCTGTKNKEVYPTGLKFHDNNDHIE